MKDQIASNRRAVMVSWLILLLAGGLAVLPLLPPAVPAETDATAFSAAQSLETIERLAIEPRPIGSPASQRARDRIVEQLRSLGLEPQLQTNRVRNYYSAAGETIDVVNVVARIPGTAPSLAVALVGHYDTVPGSLGANDDASAVAIMMETARAILAGSPLRNDLILLFTDGEEPAPRFGSSAFLSEHPWASDIGFVINLEAIGSGGPSIVIEMNGPIGWTIRQYAKAVPFPAAFSFVTETSDLVGGSNTDFATFRDEGIAGLDVAYLHGSTIYHTMADAPDRVRLSTLHQQGSNTLALARHVGNLSLSVPLSPETSKATFFTVGPSWVVRYPSPWAMPITLLAGIALAVAGWRQRVGLRSLVSVGTTLATSIITAIVAAGLWILIADVRSTMSLAESYLVLAGFVMLTAGIGAVLAKVTRRHTGTGADALGVVIVWWVLGLLAAIKIPGMSYVFVWPALTGALSLLMPTDSGRWWQLARWSLVSITALVLLVPAIDFFYQLAQPRPGNLDSEILPVIIIPVALIALVIELLRAFRVRPTPAHQMRTSNEW